MKEVTTPVSRDERDSPPLGAELYESIEREQYKIHKHYWDILHPLAVPLHFASGPRPPKQPIHVRRILGDYARELFDIEAATYPDDKRLSQWFAALALRIETIIFGKLSEITRSTGLAFHSLDYHATKDEMRAAIRAALAKHIEKYLSHCLSQPELANSTLAVAGDPSLNPPELKAQTVTSQSNTGEINARKAFVDPILVKNGWSIEDWANEARVAHEDAR
jgi:hypothetical protein